MGMNCSISRRDSSDDDLPKTGKLEERPCASVPPSGGGTTVAQPSQPTWPKDEAFTSNPTYWGPVKQLYCRTGFNLVISKSGKIRGTRKPFHKYAVLVFSSVHDGEVRIRGRETGFYLAMNVRGKLYSERDPEEEGTVFIESYRDGWNTYLSRKYAYKGWYVAINKVGKARAGHKTEYNHKSVMFLPRAIKPD